MKTKDLESKTIASEIFRPIVLGQNSRQQNIFYDKCPSKLMHHDRIVPSRDKNLYKALKFHFKN